MEYYVSGRCASTFRIKEFTGLVVAVYLVLPSFVIMSFVHIYFVEIIYFVILFCLFGLSSSAASE